MATTSVLVLGSEGGYGSVISGTLTGDSNRTVTISALANSNEYEFVEWEIVIDESSTDNSTGTGTGTDSGTGGTSGGGGGGGADEIMDGTTLIDTRF